MSFAWTDAQFVAGALCLDFANTVIHPADPARRADRLVTAADLGAWATRSGAWGAGQAGGARRLSGRRTAAALLKDARRLRQAIDGVFRAAAEGRAIEAGDFRLLLKHHREALADVAIAATPRGVAPVGGRRPIPVLALVAHSAVALAHSPRLARVKACPACGWLFVDATKANARRWCDMRTCGNRAKARRHHRRAAGRA